MMLNWQSLTAIKWSIEYHCMHACNGTITNMFEHFPVLALAKIQFWIKHLKQPQKINKSKTDDASINIFVVLGQYPKKRRVWEGKRLILKVVRWTQSHIYFTPNFKGISNWLLAVNVCHRSMDHDCPREHRHCEEWSIRSTLHQLSSKYRLKEMLLKFLVVVNWFTKVTSDDVK